MGSSTALMVVNAVNTLSVSRTDIASPGTVLAVSPDGSTIVLSDPVKQTIYSRDVFRQRHFHLWWCRNPRRVAPTTRPSTSRQATSCSSTRNYTGWTSISPATTGRQPCNRRGDHDTQRRRIFRRPSHHRARLLRHQHRDWPDQRIPMSSILRQTPLQPSPTASPRPTTAATCWRDRDSCTNAERSASDDPDRGLPGDWRPDLLQHTLNHGSQPDHGNRDHWRLADLGLDLAFVTYSGSGGVLPAYAPASSGPGQITYVNLSGSATAPLAGVLSTDNTTLYTGTATDNLVHLITRSTLTDSSTLAPNLTNPNGTVVPVDLLVQKPRKTT